MRLDLHVHTKYSADGSVEPENYLKIAHKKGLKGLAITDHNEIKGAVQAVKLSKKYKDLIIIQGVEISSSEGHILGYGVAEPIPRGLSPEETIERISAQGGVPAAAHPFRRASGLGPGVVKNVKFDIVEILNHRSTTRENLRAKELAQELNAGTTGGSDAHYEWELGLAATEFEIESGTKDEILTEMAKKRTLAIGESSTPIQGMKMYVKLGIHWLKRGFKRV